MRLASTWVPDVVAGALVLLLGLWEALATLESGYHESFSPWLIVITMAVAVTLVRRAGWWSLGILWVLLVWQAAVVTDIMLVESAVVLVAFGLARWGSKALAWVSGLSIPIATCLALGYITLLINGIWGTRIARNLFVPLVDGEIPWPLVVTPMIAGVLGLPWLAGLALRIRKTAVASRLSQSHAEADAVSARRERSQMEEIAMLREAQARLARDVHDVVGHSLTVILAQAESAPYLDRTDPDALTRVMANIAASARSSLREVRAVLASPDGSAHRSDLDALIDETRASGNHISVTDDGDPRPLPPELSAVAFRVLQEMLTNAIKHGQRGTAIAVARDWDDRLRVTVTNSIDCEPSTVPFAGNGIGGMRRRLESVGGSLAVQGPSADGGHFTVTATLPVRAHRPPELSAR
ncbi:sensor histidine kinase [Leifsonia sp. NPDC058230]|uniref:sensor histidine kinase n=1 Tax=Leifsonia sp. NPDC058230 TaxID=3346391 RepID=UPI0036DBFD67